MKELWSLPADTLAKPVVIGANTTHQREQTPEKGTGKNI
jgi:hypothetical protein